MNKIIGIIAEYNPFHNGHLWQINTAKKALGASPVIAIMSGNFTQRGTPSILNKWQRAKMAVQGGVDLVLELPFLSACKSAELFAMGAIQILDSTNIVSHLCFGSEYDNLDTLTKIAKKTYDADFSLAIKNQLQQGKTYAKATEMVIKEFFPYACNQIHSPNSILAIEYIKALIKTNSKMQPLLVKRYKAQHLEKEITSNIASASAIRVHIQQNSVQTIQQAVPKTSFSIIQSSLEQNEIYLNDNIYEKIIFYRLRQLSNEQIKNFADISEGLENKIKESALKTSNLQELIDAIVSKRYVKTRILRILSQLLVINSPIAKHNLYPYMRILAFNDTGRHLIKKIAAVSPSALINNFPDFYKSNKNLDIKQSLDIDINATDTYQLLLEKNNAGMDFLQKPAYL